MVCSRGESLTCHHSTMNIALFFRPVRVRLLVAYMADAYNDGYKQCKPGNTAERLYEMSQKSIGHPYQSMWEAIDRWYDNRKMYELSDSEIINKYEVWKSSGFKSRHGEDRTGVDLMRSKKRWEDRLWTRYEEKRNGRRKAAKYAVLPVLAMFGLPVPEE